LVSDHGRHWNSQTSTRRLNEQQVEALAEYFDDQMVTKADLASGLAAVRAELATVEARLETKIEQARSDTINWVVGVAFAQAAMILAVLRFLPFGHS
jgi:transcriptional regulator